MNVKRFVGVMGAGISALAVLVLLWLVSISSWTAVAQTGTGVIRVATTGDDVPGCGGSADPCATIQYAVDLANPGDEIHVATGVYDDLHVRPRNDVTTAGVVTQVVYLSKTVAIRGGYIITGGTFIGPPDPEANPTILDARGLGRVLYVTGFPAAPGQTISPTVEGLRITGGDAADLGGVLWGQYNAGGGVYAIGSELTLLHNQVFENRADDGGGIYILNAVEPYRVHAPGAGATLTHNQVFSNTAARDGGGVYVVNIVQDDDGHPTLALTVTVIIVDNRVFDNAAQQGSGGGVYLYNKGEPFGDEYRGDILAVVSRNQVFGNTAGQGDGGGLNLHNTVATLADNIITGNTASRNGGGLSLGRCLFCPFYGPPAKLDGNTIGANHAGHGGGGVYLYQYATLANSVVISNSADYGGGLFVHFGGGTFTNTVVTDNWANRAGSGLHFTASESRLLHSTIARNGSALLTTGGGDGSGVCISPYQTGSILAPTKVALTNTIIASQTVGVTVTSVVSGEPWGDAVTLDGVLWFGNETNVWGTGPITVTHAYTGDPHFADDGYHLAPGSMAIDRAVDASVTTDIDGDPRPLGSGYDIGADELVLYRVYLPAVLRDP